MTVYVLYITLSVLLLFLFKIVKIYNKNFLVRLSTENEMLLYNFDVDFKSETPTYYYGDFTKCIIPKKHCILDDGVFRIGGTKKETSEINICGVCEYALINLDKYFIEKENNFLNNFKENLDWLENNYEIKDGMAYWYYNYDMGNHFGKWASSISQGMAISVLVRAYVLYKNEKYLIIAKKAAKTLLEPIHNNGFKYCYDHFKCWFEESNSNSHILNGHIYAMLGLYDLYRVTKDKKYIELFNLAVNDIKKNISFFDLNFASTYCSIEKNIANNSYNKINAVLFEILHKITGDTFFREKSNKWQYIYNSKKDKFLGFIYTLNLIVNIKIVEFGKYNKKRRSKL